LRSRRAHASAPPVGGAGAGARSRRSHLCRSPARAAPLACRGMLWPASACIAAPCASDHPLLGSCASMRVCTAALAAIWVRESASHSALLTPIQDPSMNATFFFKGRACSLSSKFVGSGTSHYSSLAQDAHQDCARVDTSLGTREDEIRILHHICDDIACCRMPWLVWVRPRSACKSTVCVLRARAAAGDMAARRVGHTCTQRSMPGAHGLET